MSSFDLCCLFVTVNRQTYYGNYEQSMQALCNADTFMRKELTIPQYKRDPDLFREAFFAGTYSSFLSWKKRFDETRRIVIHDMNENTNLGKWFFITVGYDDKSITDEKIIKFSQKVAELKYWDEVNYVNEKFRRSEAGEIMIHHHTHYLVKTSLPKSKVVQYVYQTVKSCVVGQQFVDVKSYKDKVGTYEQKLKYIQGEKIESKMECVEMDRKWRQEKGIPSSY